MTENSIRRSFRVILALGLFAPLVLTGCFKQEPPSGFVPMSGQVKLDGNPLPNAQVEITTQHGVSYGRTDANGKFQAEYSRSQMGAGVGPATVRIRTSVVFPDETLPPSKNGEPAKPEILPEKYNTKSELQIEVTPKGSPYVFDLSSK